MRPHRARRDHGTARGSSRSCCAGCWPALTPDHPRSHGGDGSPVDPAAPTPSARSSGRSSPARRRAVRPVTAVARLASAASRRPAPRHRHAGGRELRAPQPARDRRLRPQPARRVRRPHRAPPSTLGYALVPARVVGIGAAQSFSRTVTIDAGTDAPACAPDLTVVNADGLVGRVLRVTRTTATVLLIVDAESVVGGRVGREHEDRLPARPRRPRPATAGSTSSWSTTRSSPPGRRRRGHVGQPGRRAVRRRRPGRPGRLRSTAASGETRSAR